MSASRGALKAIAPIPTAADFLDIVLSKTQRKTPTQIHKGFKISRIRSFYMRKVKFTQEAFGEKLQQILDEFPILDNLHPFLSSLLNVLYDKNHYKLALGQINTCKHLIDSVGKDYVRLLKFGDSLYRCKQLKRAALGRMATIMKRQKEPLAYLEQVRQHMSRLPAIDPTTRTLLICGYPNVGKSSFINKVTRADVDVQPYAFTTKSLFVGHMDYKYLRWQVVDTPGILDHPLEEMNTIEMQSITALAHLRSCIMYFMDLSEQCGYTLEAQIKLFTSIKPLFANKPVFVVINKIDVTRPDELDAARKAMLDEFEEANKEDGVKIVQLSCLSEEGVMDVRNSACDALLNHRVESKQQTKRVDNVANRIRVAMPAPRDRAQRQAFIPEGVLKKQQEAEERKARRLAAAAAGDEDALEDDEDDLPTRKLERDLEAVGGGAGVYSHDMQKIYLLKDDEWKYDKMPHVLNGKNVADFIDPDILDRLDALEAEEEKLEQEGFYDSDEFDDEEINESDEEAIRETAKVIRAKRTEIKDRNRLKDKKQNRAVIPRPKRGDRNFDDMTRELRMAGIDPTKLEERAKALALARGVSLKITAGEKRKRNADAEEMDVDEEGDDTADITGASSSKWADVSSDDDEMETDGKMSTKKRKTIAGRAVAAAAGRTTADGKRHPVKNRATLGMRDATQQKKAVQLTRLAARGPNRLAKAGESDRHVGTKMPKHLFSGKRSMGTASHR
ncbi:nucleolar GTP-binding protein 1 [Cystobasidium minutum MCA 4210]|uniref:nucleolar GTP-binding protein 1 n=1 Tax=Cystobasidium minutum MCA 4210 TaxID=1397322 RepID=UPI0034CF3251|eukprot:jgi/Rhomi1/61514/CE61513_520